MNIERARQKLDGMLAVAGLPKKPSYNRSEVCRILGISTRTFWRMIAQHEVIEASDAGRHPWTLDSYMTRGHHRVRYDELTDYLARNRGYERANRCNEAQLLLPGME